MKRKLEQGTTLVVDRYAFSGAAFTSAKPVSCYWGLFFFSPPILSLSNSPSFTPSCLWEEQQMVWPCLSPAGFLSWLVQAGWCGTAEARPRHISTAQSTWGCSQRPFRRREIWDHCFPRSGQTEIWTAGGGFFSQLAGMKAGLDCKFMFSHSNQKC